MTNEVILVLGIYLAVGASWLAGADLASAVHQAIEPTYVSVWVAGGSQ